MAISGNTPIAYYPLGGSSTGDASSTPNTLTVPNDAVPSATVFDFTGGSGEYISTNSTTLLNGETEASFNFWLKAESGIANFDGIICQRSSGGAYLLIHIDDISGSDYRIYIQQSNGSVYTVTYTPRNLSIDNWYQVCVKGSVGSKWDIYVNGSLNNDAQGANNIGGIVQDSALKIGQDTSGRELVGEMSNVQIWNKNLSTGNITTLYNNGVPYTGTQPEAANLKGWWKMNVDTSNWDGSDWTISNSSANYPNSLQFNGTSSYIDTSSFTTSGDDVTISIWLNAINIAGSSPSTTGALVYGDANNFIYYNVNEVIYAKINGSVSLLVANSGGVPQIFGTGNWHHLAIVKSGSTVTWYVDGNSFSDLGSGGTGGFTFKYIGAAASISNYYLNGSMDEVAIFDYALTSKQIKQDIYEGTTTGKTADLNNISNLTPPVAWYRMGD